MARCSSVRVNVPSSIDSRTHPFTGLAGSDPSSPCTRNVCTDLEPCIDDGNTSILAMMRIPPPVNYRAHLPDAVVNSQGRVLERHEGHTVDTS